MIRNTPAVQYKLWNPRVAVAWSFLFSPAFGASLHAINWREIGEPRLAKANMMWVWGTLAFLVVNAATLLFELPKIFDSASRSSGLALWAAWYWSQGSAQVKYVKDFGGDYVKKGWARPLLAAFLAMALYFAICFALAWSTLPSLPKSREPEVLAAWIEPRILNKWHENPELKDAVIQKIVFDHQEGDKYTGTVEATFGGTPERFKVDLVMSDDSFEWKLKALHDTPAKPGNK